MSDKIGEIVELLDNDYWVEQERAEQEYYDRIAAEQNAIAEEFEETMRLNQSLVRVVTSDNDVVDFAGLMSLVYMAHYSDAPDFIIYFVVEGRFVEAELDYTTSNHDENGFFWKNYSITVPGQAGPIATFEMRIDGNA